MIKRIVSSFLILVLLSAVVGCSSQATNTQPDSSSVSAATYAGTAKKVVNVGLNNIPNPPFSYLDEKNEPTGFTIDYLKELEKQLPEYKFQYEAVDQNSQLIGTDSGKYAFSINFFFKNPEREEKYLFPEHEYGYSVTGLIVKSNRDDIKTLDDLVGKKLTPVTPTGGLTYFLKDYNIKNPNKQIGIEYIDTSTITDNLKLVDSGKYDAFFTNIHSFENANKQLKLDLKVGGIISKEPVWALFNKSQTELAKKIDDITVKLKDDGTLSKLAIKWFNVDFFKSVDYLSKGYQYRKED